MKTRSKESPGGSTDPKASRSAPAGAKSTWHNWLHRPIVLVGVFAALVNAFLSRTPFPFYDQDSPTYLNVAQAIRHGTFLALNKCERVPLFPLFTAALGGTQFSALAGNLVVGVITAVLLYRIFELLTGSPRWAGAIAVLFVLNPGTIRFEQAVLSETLSTFFVVAGTLLAINACNSREHLVRYTGLSSLAFSCAALTRPTFELLPLVALAAILAFRKGRGLDRRIAAKTVLAALIPFTALVIGWMTFNYVRYGWFTLTTLEGIHLTNRVSGIMDDAPPQYAKIVQIYSRYAQIRIRTVGTSCNTIWHAAPEIMRATGLKPVELSHLLAGLAMRLMISHPFVILRGAATSFANFWLVPNYSEIFQIPPPTWLEEALSGGAPGQWPFGCFYLLLLFAYALALGGPVFLKDWRPVLWAPGVWIVHCVILYTAVISSIAECGGGGRFKVPVDGLYIGVAVMALRAVVQELGRRHQGGRGAV